MKSSSIIGGTGAGKRQANDFYGTPSECTWALLTEEERHISPHTVLEPCCGDGAISRILEGRGMTVRSWDLIDRGYGDVERDFLTSTDPEGATAVVTNPPYNLAERFIRHSFEELGVTYMAMLLKSQFWHAKTRQKLWEDHPPAHIYYMTWRPDFLGLGAPTMDFIWVVWRPDHVGPTAYSPMNRPIRVDGTSGW